MLVEKNDKEISSKFYCPSCKFNNCDGILKIKFNNNIVSIMNVKKMKNIKAKIYILKHLKDFI